jgi:hypothetical protein
VAGVRGDTAQALSDAAWFEDLGLQPFETIAFRVAIAAGLGDAEGAMQLLREADMHWSFFGYGHVVRTSPRLSAVAGVSEAQGVGNDRRRLGPSSAGPN